MLLQGFFQTINCFMLKFVDQEAFKETVFEEKKDEEKEIEDVIALS